MRPREAGGNHHHKGVDQEEGLGACFYLIAPLMKSVCHANDLIVYLIVLRVLPVPTIDRPVAIFGSSSG